MIVILSNTLKRKYKSYKVVPSISEVIEGVESNKREFDNLSGVILHQTAESETELGLGISRLNESGIKTIAYINSKPSVILMFSIKAIGGMALEDEFYLEESTLDLLFNSDVREAIEVSDNKDTSLEIIADFVTAFITKDKKISTDFYLRNVKDAISDLTQKRKKTELDIRNISMSAVEIFKEVGLMLSEMQKQATELSNNISKMGNSVQKEFIVPISNYPTFRYIGTSRVLSICEVSPCRYLTSFVLSYAHFLKTSCNIRVKVVILHQKSKRFSSRYSELSRVMSINSDEALFRDEIVVTDSPKNDVLEKLTHTGEDVIIIIDRLYGDPIISGRVESLYAVSGLSDLKRYKIAPNKAIFTSIHHKDCFLHIPQINSFGSVESVRLGQYFQSCKDTGFKRLNSLLQIE